MKSSAKSLLLEMMLLRHRYSTQDMADVIGMLRGHGDMSEYTGIMELMTALGSIKPKSVAKNESALSPAELKGQFLARLRQSKAANANKRIAEIAARLNIVVGYDRTQSVNSIKRALDRMSDADLSEFLRKYKPSSSPDKGYVGLANYLIHNAGDPEGQ